MPLKRQFGSATPINKALRRRLTGGSTRTPTLTMPSAFSWPAIKSAKPRAIRTRELPFLKRVDYKPEGEFRVIFESRDETLPSLQIPVANACIRRISLSPWLHSSLSSTTVATIRSILGCEQLHISRSTLISNEQWKALAQNAASASLKRSSNVRPYT